MKTVGDRIEVVIRPPNNLNAWTSVSGTLVEPGNEVRLEGEIVRDYGDQWLVKLDTAFNGKNHIVIRKSAKLVS